MTPKEKAVELYKKIESEVYDVEAVDGGGWDNCRLLDRSIKAVSKQCALIAVDEILKEVLPIGARNGEERTKEIYWQQVKTELQNL